jgi:rRNA maturation RNase YbeY
MKEVIEFVEETETSIQNFDSISSWLIKVIQEEGKFTGVITYVFMDDESLLKYNIQYLDHDFYTDVITFDDSTFPEISGDILVSVDRIIDNAKQLATDFNEEFLRVLVHGVLHLCGYKDKLESEEKLMRQKEAYYLNKVDFRI